MSEAMRVVVSGAGGRMGREVVNAVIIDKPVINAVIEDIRVTNAIVKDVEVERAIIREKTIDVIHKNCFSADGKPLL